MMEASYSHLLPLYDGLQTAVERADLWRYMVVHKFGGGYAGGCVCVWGGGGGRRGREDLWRYMVVHKYACAEFRAVFYFINHINNKAILTSDVSLHTLQPNIGHSTRVRGSV